MTRRFPRKRPNPVSTIIPRLAMRGDKALAVVERSQSVGSAAMNAIQWNEKEFSPHHQHYYLDRPVWLVTILYGRHSAQKPPRAAFRNRGRRRTAQCQCRSRSCRRRYRYRNRAEKLFQTLGPCDNRPPTAAILMSHCWLPPHKFTVAATQHNEKLICNYQKQIDN